jgi:hypothetical protein
MSAVTEILRKNWPMDKMLIAPKTAPISGDNACQWVEIKG